jgi:hypothetical protein
MFRRNLGDDNILQLVDEMGSSKSHLVKKNLAMMLGLQWGHKPHAFPSTPLGCC